MGERRDRVEMRQKERERERKAEGKRERMREREGGRRDVGERTRAIAGYEG